MESWIETFSWFPETTWITITTVSVGGGGEFVFVVSAGSGGSTGLLVSGGVVGDMGISTAASVDSKEEGEVIGTTSSNVRNAHDMLTQSRTHTETLNINTLYIELSGIYTYIG